MDGPINSRGQESALIDGALLQEEAESYKIHGLGEAIDCMKLQAKKVKSQDF